MAKNHSRGKSSFFNLSLAVMTILLGTLFAEGMLILKNSSMQNYDIEMWKYAKQLKKLSDNPILGHEHIPNSSAVLQSVKIRINSLGLRGGEIESFDKRRILFLGSSITLGWGVNESETVTERIQTLFKEKNESVLVMNAGIGNYNAVRSIERYFTKLQSTAPTDIVIHAFVRDAEPIELGPGAGNFFLKHSQLAVTLWTAYHRLFQKQGESTLVDHYRQFYDDKAASFQAMKQAYQKLAEHAKQNNIRVYFVMTPDIHNLKNYPLSFVHAQMKQIAEANGFIYEDLLPVFEGLDTKQIWAMSGDPHPNGFGHQLMSEAIFKLLNR